MNLSRKNLLARYYKWLKGELPQDLCAFFWGSLFNVLLFFIVVPGKFWANLVMSDIKAGRNFWNGIAFYVCYVIAIVIGVVTLNKVFGYSAQVVDSWWKVFYYTSDDWCVGICNCYCCILLSYRRDDLHR